MNYKPITPAQADAFDAWRFLNSELITPDSYLTMTFYGMIAAALERRVCYGDPSDKSAHRRFCNLYTILVGPPGIGKGLILRQINQLLRENKRPQQNSKEFVANEKGTPSIPLGGIIPAQPLFNLSPESVTPQKLYEIMAVRALQRHEIKVKLPNGAHTQKPYFHRSLTICLEELSSMIKRRDPNALTLMDFLVYAYDGTSFTYETRSCGDHVIDKLCLNIIAGTQPGFLAEISGEALLNEGFSSRCMFVCEQSPRKFHYGNIKMSEEQSVVYKKFAAHLKALSGLYGFIKHSKEETPEAFNLASSYHEKICTTWRANPHEALKPYYARHDSHLMKLAAAIHFSYSTSLEVFPEDFAFAISILEDIEVRMTQALIITKNPLAKLQRSVLSFLKRKKQAVPYGELLVMFTDDGRVEEINEVLAFLQMVGQIRETVTSMCGIALKAYVVSEPILLDSGSAAAPILENGAPLLLEKPSVIRMT